MRLKAALGFVVLGLCPIIPMVHAEDAPATEEQKQAAAEKLNAAVDAASAWLKIVDEGHYRESWDAAAEFFKEKVPQDQWESSLRQIRPPFGKVVSREVSDVRYLTYIPGSPAGQYVVIQFKTDFEDKHGSVETVTPMLEKDGSWKVSGYYIR